ncbi:hypothetical protein A7985_14680 [Pseudoalteromonas luteoviolacea]|uniref:Carrier domain-containing protein n=1 Tax=Pseudoalteromonas luteoviolacea TaxID=43657 RepID=A0A1C0TQ45_9GAMM|nr:non-ribosomal peptide synthetase [Pseudoalteromonas luteoviolacea]OCQ21026.1 hypothetical protein A7985_14680 [Pseudoalteromonas luteoviolacea]
MDLRLADLLNQLDEQSICIWVEEGGLAISADSDLGGSAILKKLKQYKQLAMDYLQSNEIYSEKAFQQLRNTNLRCLSFGQASLLFIERFEKGSDLYHMPHLMKLKADTDLALLERAFADTVSYHDILNSVYRTDANGLDYQTTEECFNGIATKVLSSNERFKESLKGDIAKPFDLANESSLRVVNYQLPEHSYLLIVWHHICFDGWSFNLFMQTLSNAYDSLKAGEETNLAKQDISYTDYAVWQRGHLQGDTKENLLTFWKQQLDGFSQLNLPTDFSRPDTKNYEGQNLRFYIGPELSEQLRALAKQHETTLFTLLLSAYYVSISTLANQKDIVVGSAFDNRSHPQTQSIVGLFSNLLPLRAKIDSSMSIKQLITQVHNTLIDAKLHQDLPFSQLISELELGHDPANTPIFNTTFALEHRNSNPKSNSFTVADFEPEMLYESYCKSKFDLSLTCYDGATDIELLANYATSLFEAKSISRLVEMYKRVLTLFVDDTDMFLSELDCVTESERSLLLTKFAGNTSPLKIEERTINQVFDQVVAAHPDKKALTFNDHSLTYNQLNDRVNQLAKVIASSLAKSDAEQMFVGLYLHRNINTVVSILAVLKAGAAYVPISLDDPEMRIRGIVEDIKPQLIITNSASKEVIQQCIASLEVAVEVHSVDDIESHADIDAPLEMPKVSADDLAYVIFTSGTTGKPKGVMVQHKSVTSLISSDIHFDKSVLKNYASFTTYSFDPFGVDLFHTIANSACLHLYDIKTMAGQDQFIQSLNNNEIDSCILTTSLFHQWAEAGLLQQTKLKNIMIGGEKANPNWVQKVRTDMPQVRIINAYGPTESTIITTISDCKTPSDALHIGKPIDGRQTYILDADRKLCPLGTVGELYIGGNGLATGYINNQQLTEERFIDNPFASSVKGQAGSPKLYKTGDLVRYLPDGNIAFIGRVDEQIKLRGFRIELGEISSSLIQHPEVDDAVAIAHKDGDNTNQLFAYYTTKSSVLSSEELQQFARSMLPKYMLPNALIKVDSFSLNANGKLDKSTLPIPSHFSESTFSPAQGEREATLASIWQSLLGLERVGRDQSFFELGGHSIKAMQLQEKIRLFFDVDVSLQVIFQAPTIAELARLIEEKSNQHCKPISKVARDGKLPLSMAQQRMWFLHHIETHHSSTYNVPLLTRLSGELNQKALCKALSTLLARHEVLRSRFIEESDGPTLTIVPPSDIALPITVFESEEALIEDCCKEASKKFDLANESLVRMRLASLSPEENYLQLTFHHIVTDGWSISVFLNELGCVYNDLVNQREAKLDALPYQYIDFAAYQNVEINDAFLSTQLNYWKQKLANVQPVLNMPTDKVRPPIKTYNGTIKRFQLSSKLLKQLKELSKEEDVTLYMTLFAAYNVLLQRYCQQDDISIGSAAANRDKLGTQNLVGLFVNTLVLRSDVSSEKAFTTLLKEVKETVVSAYQHQYIPLELLIHELGLERNLSYDPLFQTMFNFHTLPDIEYEWHDLSLELHDLETGTAKFDLNMSLAENQDGIGGSLEYNTDLFEDATIERLVIHFENILHSIVANRYQKITDITLLDEAEKQTLLFDWNNTASDYSEHLCIHELFEKQVQKTPEAIAISSGQQMVSYQQLNRAANKLARQLVENGIKPNQLVGIMMTKSPELIVALLAILKAGGAYVPVDPTYPEERIYQLLTDSGVQLVITEHDIQQSLSLKVRSIFSSSSWLDIDNKETGEQYENIDKLSLGLTSSDLSYVIYTSGSTGNPKGVVVQHKAVVNVLEWINNAFEVTESDNLLFVTSISFDLSVYDIFGILAAGASLHLAPEEVLNEPARVVELLTKENITIWDSAPASLNRLTPYFEQIDQSAHHSTLRLVMLSGDWIPVHLPDTVTNAFPTANVISLGGATEATIWSNYYRIGEVAENWPSIPYGKPIQNAQYYVLDKRLSLCPIGVVGDLYISGDCLAKEYLNAPEKTTEKFVPHFYFEGKKMYATGDLARWMSDGNLQFIGRDDGQVKVRGYRIELGEIEKRLTQLQNISDAIVLAHTDNSGEKHLCAYLIVSTGWSLQHTKQRLAKLLPDYMVPNFFTEIDSLPITPNGKLDKKKLPGLNVIRSKLTSEDHVPKSVMEQKVSEMIQGVLGLESLGTRDNLFDLGATSLSLTKINGLLNGAFERQMSLVELFQSPSISGIVSHIAGDNKVQEEDVDSEEEFEFLQNSMSMFDDS